jgi:hypothetical protein
MLHELASIRDQLNELRENIVKLGPEWRQKEIGKNKLLESNELYKRAADIVSLFDGTKNEFKLTS